MSNIYGILIYVKYMYFTMYSNDIKENKTNLETYVLIYLIML